MKNLHVFNRWCAIALFMGGCSCCAMAAPLVDRVAEDAHRLTGINFSGGELSYQLIFEYNEAGKLIKVMKIDDNAPEVMNDEVQFSYGTNQVHMSTSYFEKIYEKRGEPAKTHELALHGTFILNKVPRAYTYVGKVIDSKAEGPVATQYSMSYGAGNTLTKVVDDKDTKHRGLTLVWKGNTCTSIKDAQQVQLQLSYGDQRNPGNLALNPLLIGGLRLVDGVGVSVDYLHAMGYLGKTTDQLVEQIKVDTKAVRFGNQTYDPNPEYTFTYQYDESGRLVQVDAVRVDQQKKVGEGQEVTISNETVRTPYVMLLTYE